MRRDGNRNQILTIVLIVLLALAVGYIAFEKISLWNRVNQLGNFQQGAQYGYQQAIVEIAQKAEACQQVPLVIGNKTVNVFAIKCLQQK